MTRPRPAPARPTLVALVGAVALLVCLTIVSAASAQGSSHFRRGHLPAIGEIKLAKQKGDRVEIVAPVTYTQALSGHPTGLESAEVTLHIARQVKHRRAVGITLTRTHHHLLLGTGTVIDHFRLDRRASRWLLSRGRKERGRLVRVDVRHRIKQRRGARPLHEKDASLTMASSHRARAQGEDAFLTVRNDTAEPVETVSEPILCMYTNGEGGSNLQAFTTPESAPLQPGGTIEAAVEGSASLLDEAEYQGGTGEGAGHWFDWTGVGADLIANAFDYELTPLFLGWDLARHCDAQASTFMLVAGNQTGEAASSEVWVLTSETCRHGCVDTHLPTAAEALNVQGVGEEGINPGVWAEESTQILKALVGGWREPPAGGKVVQDQGLHWSRQELPEAEEEVEYWTYEGYGTETISRRAWDLSIHPGSSPAGYSG
jgi:hypothetical protein